MRLTEDTAKLLRRRGLAGVVVVIGRRAAAERMESLEAMVVVVVVWLGKYMGGWIRRWCLVCV
jgi:hypothetical protein